MTLGKRSHAPTQFTAVMPTNSTASCDATTQKLSCERGLLWSSRGVRATCRG